MAVRLIEDFEEYKKNPKLHIKRSNGRVYEYITSSAPVGSEYGDGVEKNYAKALEWCIKAAEQGDPEAQKRLLELKEKQVHPCL